MNEIRRERFRMALQSGFYTVFTWGAGYRDLQPHMPSLYEVMGWKGNKIPAEFTGIVSFQGATFRICPSITLPSGRKSSKHRVHIVCKACQKLIPAGRLRQHIVQSKDHVKTCGDCGGVDQHHPAC